LIFILVFVILFFKTKIQDELCEKRTLATIATHDMTKLKGDSLVYEARDPNQINVIFDY